VIHRDLKPANIMVGSFGEVQVMDWGLAKVLIQPDDNECLKSDETPDAGCEADAHEESATGSLNRSTNRGTVMGTPAYMSPEQAQGEMQRVNEASDVFGLGAILCEVLTGQPPYVGKDIRRQAKNAELVDAFSRLDECGIDGRLLVIAKRCLAPEPLDRPRQAGELAAELKAYLESVADRLRRTELENVEIRARARHERKMRWMTSALAAMVLLVGLVGTAGWTRVQDERATRTKILQTYQERLERSARLGWWTEATHNFSEALRLAPEDQFFAFAFAPLLIQVGDLEGYRQHCQKLLTNWKDTDNIFFADQTAKACLLSAEAVIDPRKLSRLVQTALSAGPTHSEYKFFLLLRGFHAYRGGEFAEALAACQESRRYNQGPAENLQLTATDHAVEALAHHRLGHVDEASQSLAAAKRFVDERFESLVEGDLGEDWPNWLIAQLICSEAEALVEGKSEPRDEAEINTSAGIKRYPQELIVARISQRNIDRGHGSARHGAWAEAAHNFSEALALVPEDERSAFLLAPLLVQIGELDGYRQHCQALLAQWKNTNNVFFADQIAKACLLTPEAVSSPQELTRLVETALSAGPEHTEYKFFLLLKGLYDYRNGEFAEAVDACQACRRRNTKPAENLPLTAATHAIEAMAQHQFSHLDLSRQNLAMAQRIVDPQFAKLARGGDLGDDWHDWLIAQLLAREAESRLSDQRER
jgi:thioredoxin-like negative regulator of GroEL